jgi:hypothetical protein
VLRLADILLQSGLALTQVAVILHTPTERRLRQLLPLLAHERRELFEAYQSTHNAQAAATLLKRAFVASFIGMPDRSLIFAGLYQRSGTRDRPRAEIGADPAVRTLIAEFGTLQEFAGAPEGNWLWFDLFRTEHLSEYIGRLRIAPDRLTRTYVRLAENFDIPVAAIERENVLVAPAPRWQDMMPTGQEVRVLPSSWQARLREWRGIYLITDQSDGRRYVGSAYGETNLLGRWQTHVARDVGVTAELRHRDPAGFRFSILQLVAQDMPAEDVIRLGRNWMNRLDTIENGLNR